LFPLFWPTTHITHTHSQQQQPTNSEAIIDFKKNFSLCEGNSAYVTWKITAPAALLQTLFDMPEMNCFVELLPRTEKNFCFKFFGVWPIKALTLELPFSPLILIALRGVFRFEKLDLCLIFESLKLFFTALCNWKTMQARIF